MRAAVYARVSTERQGRDQTIDSQLGALRGWAVANGHELEREHTYIDVGYSGSRLDRPALSMTVKDLGLAPGFTKMRVAKHLPRLRLLEMISDECEGKMVRCEITDFGRAVFAEAEAMRKIAGRSDG
jgi:predicted site-specific integrase-resolvase